MQGEISFCFLIGPRDTQSDFKSAQEAAIEWTRVTGSRRGRTVLATSFLDAVGPVGKPPQNSINKLLDEADFAIALFWNMPGSNSQGEIAYCVSRGKPVIVFHKQIPSDANMDQQSRLMGYLHQLSETCLIKHYSTLHELQDRLHDVFDYLTSKTPENSIRNRVAVTQLGPGIQTDMSSPQTPTTHRDTAAPHHLIRFMFRPLRQYLESKAENSVFFLTLHPTYWEPIYCGLAVEGDDAKAKEILAALHSLRSDHKPNSAHYEEWRILDKIAQWFLNPGHDFDHLTRGAASILQSESDLTMGSEIEAEGSPFEGDLEVVRTLGWFQEALKVAGLPINRYESAIAEFGSGLEVLRDPNNHDTPLGLCVREYMRRHGLLSGRLPIFLAEFLLFLGSIRAKRTLQPATPEPSNLSHYFIPLRSNGQWRTTACWLSTADDENSFQDCISFERRAVLNHLCSQIFLEIFSLTLLKRLSAARSLGERTEALYQALTQLWWGNVFLFYRGRDLVLRAERSGTSRELALMPLKMVKPVPSRASEGEFLSARRYQGTRTLVLDILAMPGGRGEEVSQRIGVDILEIWVGFFDVSDRAALREIGAQVAVRIAHGVLSPEEGG